MSKSVKTPRMSNDDVLKVLQLTTDRHPWLYKKTHLLCNDFARDQEMRTAFRRYALKDIVELAHFYEQWPNASDFDPYELWSAMKHMSSVSDISYNMKVAFRVLKRKAAIYDIELPSEFMEGTEWEEMPEGPPFNLEADCFEWSNSLTPQENRESMIEELDIWINDHTRSLCYFLIAMDKFVRRAYDHFKPEAFEITFMAWYPDLMDVSHMVMNGIDTPTSVNTIEPDALVPDGYIERHTINIEKLDSLYESRAAIKPLDIPRRMPDGTPFVSRSFTVLQ